ncbi:unnamed protein product [Dimorphilus gyrociliatus]|uniref:Uncharacterized protein n=1 Tax=Dimorphilus gyrociliatus TaxID=2664684 RepID=A0A7I8VQ18_9ANNE|nr:unnamed protein product [Dimorphilus gyrociliatus]
MLEIGRVMFGDCAFVAHQRRPAAGPEPTRTHYNPVPSIRKMERQKNVRMNQGQRAKRPTALYNSLPISMANGGHFDASSDDNSTPTRRRRAVNRVFQEFADETSMHGVPKIINAKSLPAKIFWSIICLAAFVMFIWQTGILLARFYSYPKKVNVEIVQRPVRFPHVTVCNCKPLDMIAVNVIENLRDGVDNSETFAKFPYLSDFAEKYTKYQEQVFKFMFTTTFIDRRIDGNDTFPPQDYQYGEPDNFTFQEYPQETDMNFTGGLDTDLEEQQRRRTEYLKYLNSKMGLAANIGSEVIFSAGIQLKEFIVHCNFMNRDCNDEIAKHIFVKNFNEIFFNCFTFAPERIMENTATRLHGVEQGLNLLLFTGSGGTVEAASHYVTPGITETDSPLSGTTG